jgi:type II secretory pathway pseudopilin PulG
MNAGKKTVRKGLTLIEVLIAVGIFMLVVGVAVFIYNSINPKVKANNAYQEVQTVISAVNSVASDYGGNYPALSNAELTGNPFAPYLGRNKDIYGGIKYSCPAGVSSTITVKIPYSFLGSAKDAPDICQIVARRISKNTGWNAACDSYGNLTLTRKGSKCIK